MEGEAQKMLDQFRENYKTDHQKRSTMNVASIAVARYYPGCPGAFLEEYTTDPAWTDANGQSELSEIAGRPREVEDGGIGQYDTRMAIYGELTGAYRCSQPSKTCFEIAHETYIGGLSPVQRRLCAEAQSVKAQIEALPATLPLGTEVRCGSGPDCLRRSSDAAKALVDEATLAKLTAAELPSPS